MPLKKCVGCGEKKELTEFGSHPSSFDGKTSYCKVCRRGQNKRYREKNTTARLKHHLATRIGKTTDAPEGFTRDLEKHLGYKIYELRRKLDTELKAEEGISLRDAIDRNYHLDHIRPLSSFPPHSCGDKVFQQCWAIDNLKMVPADINLRKGARQVESYDDV